MAASVPFSMPMRQARLQLRAGAGVTSRPSPKSTTRRVLLALAGVVGLGVWCACTPSGSPGAGFLGSSTPFRASQLGEGRRRVGLVRRDAVAVSTTASALKVGDRKQVQYNNVWYDAEVLEVDGATCKVRYDEGGDEEGDVDIASRVRDIPPPMALKKGQKVEALSEGTWYAAAVLEVSADGETCSVQYDEGGEEESDLEVRKRIREPRLKFADLQVGQKFKGTVKSVAPFGAFVDIGAERDGLVHVSRMAEARVNDVNEYVSEGQEVDVWVAQVSEDGKLALAMVESRIAGGRGGGAAAPQDFSAFEGLSPEEWLTGTVTGTAPFGVFVEVTAPSGATAKGLVHVSQIRDGFVESAQNEVEVGQEVKVRVVRVDSAAGKMGLSMKGAGAGGGGGGDRGERAPRAPSDLSAFQGVSSSEWLSGKVARIAPFGIFVTVSTADGKASADGLVHITQIRDGFVESTESEAQVGQEVQVRVLSVDVGSGKMGLSMKSEQT